MTWQPRVLMIILTVVGAAALGCSGKTGTQASTVTTPPATTPPAAAAGTTTAPGSATGATLPPTDAGNFSPPRTLKPSATTKVAPVVTTAPGGRVAPDTTVGPGPPAASTGKGAIAGHVYLACGGGPPSGGACQTRLGVAGDTVMVKSGGSTVATAVSAADGSYRIDLPAGLYGLEETRGRQSTRVQVDAGHIVVADFSVT